MKKKSAIKFLIENLRGESSIKKINEQLSQSGNDTVELKRSLLAQLENIKTTQKQESIRIRKIELHNDSLNFRAYKESQSFSNYNSLQFGFRKKAGEKEEPDNCEEEIFLLKEQTKRIKEKNNTVNKTTYKNKNQKSE